MASTSQGRKCNLAAEQEDAVCVTNIIVEFDIGERECECGPPCHQTDYERVLSSTVWPGE